MQHLSVQKEVADCLRKKDQEFGNCDSPSLRKDRFICLEKNKKKDELQALIKTSAFYPPHPYPVSENKDTIVCYGKLCTPLIINQAGGILENAGCSLHRNFGYPTIPGSALKGITSHAAWRLWKTAEDPKEKDEIAAMMVAVFGYPTNHDHHAIDPAADLDAYIARAPETFGLVVDERTKKPKAFAGGVAFMAAEPYYENNTPDKPLLLKLLQLDITTSHHMKYYSESVTNESAKACDSERINPQFFISVQPAAEFRFVLRRLRKDLPDETFQRAKQWLMAAIEVLGVGAKTGAGYGIFEDCTEVKRKKQAEEAKRQQQEKDKEAKRQQQEKDKEAARARLDEIKALPESDRLPQLEDFKKTYAHLFETEQWIRDTYKRLMPTIEVSLEDTIKARWENATIKSVLNGGDIKGFEKHKDEKKVAIVKLLRSENETCKAIWEALKEDKKLTKVKDTICKFSKDHGWGKMP